MTKYKVEAHTEVCIDSYELGELDYVNSYSVSYEVEANTPKEAIELVIISKLYFTLDDGLCIEEGEAPCFSILVDRDNTELDSRELKEWKKGKFKAYNNHTTFTVYELKEVTTFNREV